MLALIAGPLIGVEGQIIKRRNRHVLIVGIELFGRVVETEIDPSQVEPV